MKTSSFISAFEKYIESIIMPMFPEIEDFRLKIEKGKEWNFKTASWKDIYELTFNVDGTDQDFEDSLRQELYTMKKIFGVEDDTSIHFRIVIDGMWNGDWYV